LTAHKFKPGDLVQFHRRFDDRRSASGVYTVVRSLPAGEDGQVQYQVKSEQESGRLRAARYHFEGRCTPYSPESRSLPRRALS
jgi:hypothetical protein